MNNVLLVFRYLAHYGSVLICDIREQKMSRIFEYILSPPISVTCFVTKSTNPVTSEFPVGFHSSFYFWLSLLCKVDATCPIRMSCHHCILLLLLLVTTSYSLYLTADHLWLWKVTKTWVVRFEILCKIMELFGWKTNLDRLENTVVRWWLDFFSVQKDYIFLAYARDTCRDIHSNLRIIDHKEVEEEEFLLKKCQTLNV